MFITLLNVIAPIAITVFAVGVTLKMGRWFNAVLTPRRYRRINMDLYGAPPIRSMPSAVRATLLDPLTHFYRHSNRTWGRGYALYHIAIVTEVMGYTLAAIILFTHIVLGHAIPDVAHHAAASYNYAPANLLAIIFGNGEHLQAHFLFGPFAPIFVSVTWIAVGCAVLGNLHLMYTLIRRRSGAVVADLDSAAQGIRLEGRRPWDRVLVRSLIFCIIWTELLARLSIVPGIVFVHAALGLTLFTLLPFTYLFHIVYNVLAVGYATRRRMVGTTA